ncbi:unnamed protein product [Porites lobata]|uniref:Uncharacterized protein n=1 Tax=Porites lobata TaxID=104759 RepID=A0ABN8P8A0_9CNID|nr:unnamed protein product [Porites lobata]
MITSLRASIPQVKQAWLADDSSCGGSIEVLYQWYKSLCEEGRKFGYIVNGAKSWLIVKTSELAESAKKVFGDEVNLTLEGRRHLGAGGIGIPDLKRESLEQFNASLDITAPHVNSILHHSSTRANGGKEV